MALTKCKECGHDVSNKAKSCPKCGAPAPKRTSILTWIVAGILGLGVLSALFHLPSSQPSKQPKTSPSAKQLAGPAPSKQSSQAKVATIDKSEKMQKGRKDFIQKLINQGIFQKVEMPG